MHPAHMRQCTVCQPAHTLCCWYLLPNFAASSLMDCEDLHLVLGIR